jgi:hypothetical protein
MKKGTWKVHTIAECEDCGQVFDNYKNGQALAAQHAKKYGHVVKGEVGLAFEYDGTKTAELRLSVRKPKSLRSANVRPCPKRAKNAVRTDNG